MKEIILIISLVIIFITFTYVQGILRKRKFYASVSRDAAKNTAEEAVKLAALTQKKVLDIENINMNSDTAGYKEVIANSINKMKLAAEEAANFATKTKKEFLLEKIQEAAKQAKESLETVKSEANAAERAAIQIRREKNEILSIIEKTAEAVEAAKTALENTLSDVHNFIKAECSVEEAKKASKYMQTELSNNVKGKLPNIESKMEEANKLAAEAQKSNSMQDASNNAQKAEEAIKIIISEINKIKHSLRSAISKESSFIETVNKMKKMIYENNIMVADINNHAKKAQNMAYISQKTEEMAVKAETAAKNAAALKEKVENCFKEVNDKTTVQEAEAIDFLINDSFQQMKDEFKTAELAVAAADKEEDEKRRIGKAAQGTPQDKYDLCLWYRTNNNFEQYMHWLKQSAECENSIAQFEYGCIQFNRGEGVYWLKKLAEEGHTAAQVYLCANGAYECTDDEAFELYKKAADEKLNAMAMICVGEMYCLGKAVPLNTAKGVEYIDKGLKRGVNNMNIDPKFWFRIGKMFFNDIKDTNGRPDLYHAKEFFKKAAADGDTIANEYLRESLEKIIEQLKERRNFFSDAYEIRWQVFYNQGLEVEKILNDFNTASQKARGYADKICGGSVKNDNSVSSMQKLLNEAEKELEIFNKSFHINRFTENA